MPPRLLGGGGGGGGGGEGELPKIQLTVPPSAWRLVIDIQNTNVPS